MVCTNKYKIFSTIRNFRSKSIFIYLTIKWCCVKFCDELSVKFRTFCIQVKCIEAVYMVKINRAKSIFSARCCKTIRVSKCIILTFCIDKCMCKFNFVGFIDVVAKFNGSCFVCISIIFISIDVITFW